MIKVVEEILTKKNAFTKEKGKPPGLVKINTDQYYSIIDSPDYRQFVCLGNASCSPVTICGMAFAVARELNRDGGSING